MRVVLNEGQSCREATVTFRLNRRKGSPKNWTLRLQDQAGQVRLGFELVNDLCCANNVVVALSPNMQAASFEDWHLGDAGQVR